MKCRIYTKEYKYTFKLIFKFNVNTSKIKIFKVGLGILKIRFKSGPINKIVAFPG